MKFYLLLINIFLFFSCNDTKNKFESIEIYGCGKFQKRINNREVINRFEEAIKNSKPNDKYLKYKTNFTIYALKDKDTITFYLNKDLFIQSDEVFVSRRNFFKILELENCRRRE